MTDTEKKPASTDFKATWFLRMFGLTKVPLIWYVRPRVIALSEQRVEICIPLRWRTRNHLGAMYFGALAVGADVAGGLLAVKLIRDSGQNVSFVFKDMKGEFLKRAEGDVHFVSTTGERARRLVERALSTGERVDDTVEIIATVPSKLGDEPVAKFSLTLSLKKATRKT